MFFALMLVVVVFVIIIRARHAKKAKQKTNMRKRGKVHVKSQVRHEQKRPIAETKTNHNLMTTASHSEPTIDTDIFEQNRLTLHRDLKGLIWFINGPMQNYKKEKPRQISPGVTIAMSTSEEPSAIDITLPVEFPKGNEYVEPLGYYPRYDSLSPKQRGKYLLFLTNPYQITDIGYVFILYYGLERHLLTGNYVRAFDVILKLRNIHSNSSFQHYSAVALLHSAVIHKRRDMLRTFMQSVDKPFEESSLSFGVFMAAKKELDLDITPAEMIRYATSFGFTNHRYLKANYSTFLTELECVLRERYSQPSFPISRANFVNLPTSNMGVLANSSLHRESIEIPDVSADHALIESAASVLQEAHERVKKINREKRKENVQ